LIIGQRDRGEHGLPLDQYTEARGAPGITGEPLELYHPYYCNQDRPYRKLDCFDQKHPCIIDQKTQTGPFKSKAAVVQLILPSTSVAGDKPSIEMDWGAMVQV